MGSPKANLTPLYSLRVSKHQIPAHHRIPNTSIQHKPLLHYRSAFTQESSTASAVEAHLTAVGVVKPQWRYTMYATTHFHSTTHELLCIVQGGARLCFGGEENPGRVEASVRVGDVVLVPAGVGHRLLEEEGDEGFEMVGSYPKGCSWDMCHGKEGEEAKVEGIRRLPWFERDPVYGEEGPALAV
ncbi:uncharacterized protein PG986_010346 [Apiospora aurea]|uniref:Cupin type-2 domain-containing protein n=1 Tax=Apiospora aurea TaxID=335848 RepID=A0ABR1Q1Z0_9PEZI